MSLTVICWNCDYSYDPFKENKVCPNCNCNLDPNQAERTQFDELFDDREPDKPCYE